MTLVHGALQAFIAVLAGAFGAHGLQSVLSEQSLKVWHTGVTYQMAHALALLALGLLERQSGKTLLFPHAAFGVGILLFSGSLYLLAITGIRWLGAITPFGGTAFLLGWLALAWTAWKSR